MTANAIPAPTLRLLWWLPRLAFLLFLGAQVALLWFIGRTEQEEQRTTLISDMLWLEQNLRFALGHNVELLARFDLSGEPAATPFEPQAAALIGNHSGIVQVIWRDPNGEVRDALPPPIDTGMISDISGSSASSGAAVTAQNLAKSLGQPVYAAPYPVVQGDWQFEVHVPFFRSGQFIGSAVGVYSIRRLLEESVPWWLAQRYRLAIIDQSNQSLGVRSHVTAIEAGNSYQMPFEPPGHGLVLHATPYQTATPLASRLISAGLVLLAAVVLVSLWALRRHVQRRLEAESALQTEVAFRKAMEDSVQTGLRARNLQGKITYVNPAFCRMVGWTAEELVGRLPPMPYWAEEFIDETREMHARVMAGQAPSEGFEIRLKRSSGEIFDALIHEAPLIDSQGRHTGWMGSVIDITERKRAEDLARQQAERLQASARLITMGEMASSLAHELNQPLAAISSYAAGCRNLIATGAAQTEIDGALAKCQQQAQRAGRIIRRIYEFVRRHEPKSEPCDVGTLLADLLLLVEADARRQQVRILSSIPANLPTILADRILLGQAILNLMRNGIDAMRQSDEKSRQLAISAEASGHQVVITIADRGCGISAESASQLFEPFYTTKTEGLGVGLNICRSVVEAHHGRLWFEAAPQGGTLFHISLPLTSS